MRCKAITRLQRVAGCDKEGEDYKNFVSLTKVSNSTLGRERLSPLPSAKHFVISLEIFDVIRYTLYALVTRVSRFYLVKIKLHLFS